MRVTESTWRSSVWRLSSVTWIRNTDVFSFDFLHSGSQTHRSAQRQERLHFIFSSSPWSSTRGEAGLKGSNCLKSTHLLKDASHLSSESRWRRWRWSAAAETVISTDRWLKKALATSKNIHPSISCTLSSFRVTYRCPSLNAASQNHLSHQSKTDQILLSARCVQQHQVEATTKQKLLMLKKHLVKHLPDNELSKDEVIPEILR